MAQWRGEDASGRCEIPDRQRPPATHPVANADYWQAKFDRNLERDRADDAALKVEVSRHAHAASLTDGDCTVAVLTLSGGFDRRADGQTLTVTLRARIGGKSTLIIGHPRVRGAGWRLRLGLPGSDLETGERWTFKIAFRGNRDLRATRIGGVFVLEVEAGNGSPN